MNFFLLGVTAEALRVKIDGKCAGRGLYPVYLHGIRVKFVYEGHWVKVKVTVAQW